MRNQGKTLTWLHLSDIHFGEKHTSEQVTVLNRLLDDIRECRERHALTPDLIFVTGDIAWSGQANQYEEDANPFLERLREAAGVGSDRVFLIPGNHDVDRSVTKGKAATLLCNDLLASHGDDDEKAVTDFLISESTRDDRLLVLRKHDAYVQFVKTHYPHCAPDGDPVWYSRSVEFAGLPFGRLWVVGLNSSWLGRDGEEKGKILLGYRQVVQALGVVEKTGDAKNDFIVSLAHHPFSWFPEWDERLCGQQIDARCDFHLTGHLHETYLNLRGVNGPQRCSMMAAGSAYGGGQWYNGYHFVRLDFETGKARAFLRRYEPTKVKWTVDPRFDEPEFGQFEWDLPQRFRPKSRPQSIPESKNVQQPQPNPLDEKPEVKVPRIPDVGDVFLEKFKIESVIGKGGMGVVCKARHLTLKKLVAIKFLSPTFCLDQQFTEGFRREAEIVASIQNPHIVSVSDNGVWEGQCYLVMEYLEGETLGARLKTHSPMSAEEAVLIAEQVCEALACVHAKGITHRDLKPDNIFLHRGETGPETVKVLDFGIARRADDTRTLTGDTKGTPRYMSPEQCKGGPVDGSADLYSLGVILFEMLAGRVPFEADNLYGYIYKHTTEPAPVLTDVASDAQPGLSAVIHKVLAKKPEDRHQTARELATALRVALALPDLVLLAPAEKQIFANDAPINIQWDVLNDVSLYGFDIFATDCPLTGKGDTFPIRVATGIPALARSFNWTPGPSVVSETVSLRVMAIDKNENSVAKVTPVPFSVRRRPTIQRVEYFCGEIIVFGIGFNEHSLIWLNGEFLSSDWSPITFFEKSPSNAELQILTVRWIGEIRDPDNYVVTEPGEFNPRPGRANRIFVQTDGLVSREFSLLGRGLAEYPQVRFLSPSPTAFFNPGDTIHIEWEITCSCPVHKQQLLFAVGDNDFDDWCCSTLPPDNERKDILVANLDGTARSFTWTIPQISKNFGRLRLRAESIEGIGEGIVGSGDPRKSPHIFLINQPVNNERIVFQQNDGTVTVQFTADAACSFAQNVRGFFTFGTRRVPLPLPTVSGTKGEIKWTPLALPATGDALALRNSLISGNVEGVLQLSAGSRVSNAARIVLVGGDTSGGGGGGSADAVRITFPTGTTNVRVGQQFTIRIISNDNNNPVVLYQAVFVTTDGRTIPIGQAQAATGNFANLEVSINWNPSPTNFPADTPGRIRVTGFNANRLIVGSGEVTGITVLAK